MNTYKVILSQTELDRLHHHLQVITDYYRACGQHEDADDSMDLEVSIDLWTIKED